MKKMHQLVQGSEEWHWFRANHFGASEASAMLGISPYLSRTDLLKIKSTGILPDVDPQLQKIFDRGHEVEPGGRAIAELMIGQDLFPATYSFGRLSASCDGITMFEDAAFEHKQWSEQLAESVRQGILPDHHQPQCQQIMMVTGAEKVLFMTSDGAERHEEMWVYPDSGWQDRIRKGWDQFKADLETYEYVEERVAPVGKTPETLPTLRVEVTGMVTASNIEAFKAAALGVFRSIKVSGHSTDEDFADAEAAEKWLKKVEERLDAAESGILSQAAPINDVVTVIRDLKEEARQLRLTLGKTTKSRKDAIKTELVLDAQKILSAYISEINSDFGYPFLGDSAPFADAIKGKRTVASIKDALKTTLAHAKIEANDKADLIRANHAASYGYEHLFPDFAQLCLKPADDFAAIVKVRAAEEDERKAKEAERLKQEAAAVAVITEAAAESVSAPEPQSVNTAEIKQAAVIDSQPHIGAFLKLHNFTDHSRIRGILVEYEKFKAQTATKEAA